MRKDLSLEALALLYLLTHNGNFNMSFRDEDITIEELCNYTTSDLEVVERAVQELVDKGALSYEKHI